MEKDDCITFLDVLVKRNADGSLGHGVYRKRLVQRTTDAVGTVKITRKGIPTVLKKKLKKGEVVSTKCRKLVALKWRDKHNVSIPTTRHSIEMQPIS
ncbi:hypothetical protein J437_LFUL018792 [Ladona fulva]|uniref:PiggyBac transposable element-derived protein domain-containing protein n=1 Tax=Ladona fulva TaxID=123851 RepID=A0A8K0KQX3_LADFU|nr:hypothetical protein J437_LFUL018792 [Ladona fulva]